MVRHNSICDVSFDYQFMKNCFFELTKLGLIVIGKILIGFPSVFIFFFFKIVVKFNEPEFLKVRNVSFM